MANPGAGAGAGVFDGDVRPVNDRFLKQGAIVRVAVKNFMTYHVAEVRPGARMNLILGPNGSGKSSLVCAIVLALGGSPAVLGRAKNYAGYVKRGCKEATCQIELYQPSFDRPNTVITVTMYHDKPHTAQYTFDGVARRKEYVQDQLRQMGIDVSNLCNVLPQEQMGKFTTYDSKQLLLETEKALDVTLFDMHMQLISEQKVLNTTDAKLAQLQDEVARLEAQVEEYKAAAEAMEKRVELEWKVEILKKKILWVRVLAKRKEAERLRAERDAAKEAMKAALLAHAPLKQLVATTNAAKVELQAVCKKADNKRMRMTTKTGQSITAVDAAQADVDETLSRLDVIERTGDDLDAKIDKARGRYEAAEMELDRLEPADVLKRRQEEARQRVAACRSSVTAFTRQKGAASADAREARDAVTTAQKKLTHLGSQINARVKIAEQFGKGRTAVVVWKALQTLKRDSMFRGDVLGPVAFEITPKAFGGVSADVHGHILERLLPSWLLWAFVFTDKADEDLLRRTVGDRTWRGVSTVHVAVQKQHAVADYSHLEQYGVYGRCDQIFDAPALIRDVVEQNAYAGQTPVGDKKLEELASSTNWIAEHCHRKPRPGENVPRSRLFANVLYTPNKEFRIKVSRDQSVSFSSNYGNKPTNILRAVADKSVIAKAQRDLATARSEYERCQNKVQQISDESRAIMQEHKAAQADVTAARTAYQLRVRKAKDMARAKDDIEALQEEKALEEEMKEKNKRKLGARLKKQCIAAAKAAVVAATNISKQSDVSMGNCVARIGHYQALWRYNRATSAYQHATNSAIAYKHQLEQAQTAYKAAKQALNKLHQQAAAEAPRDSVDKRTNKTLHEVFAEYPDNEREVEDLIDDVEAQLGVLHTQKGAKANYDKARKDLAAAIQSRDDLQNATEHNVQRFEQRKARWLEDLTQHTTKIAFFFEKYFTKIGCRGTMKLLTPGTVADSAIELMVAYREGHPLQALRANTQSGGERAVATMLYLLAMQKSPFNKSPFRLVDEMNQGMDANNERQVFNLIVDACASGDRPPQYLVLTPKLLANLQYRPHCRVHIVFNGGKVMPRFAARLAPDFVKRKRDLVFAEGGDPDASDAEDAAAKPRAGKKARKAR